ncbi:MAG: CAP domain-containing protein, partial [Candidatus Promineifilaceae bacterium]|nr:CAP domain-containing protein [Candidatus Promineifilaceae bacterium]
MCERRAGWEQGDRKRPVYHCRQALGALALAAVAVILLAAAGAGRADEKSIVPAAYLPAVFAEPTPTPGPTPIPSDDPAKELEVLALINQERVQRGLAALQPADAITQATRRHSRDMADHDFFSHT